MPLLIEVEWNLFAIKAIKFGSIHCQICVERDSQKGIIIGKGGAMLKEIGTAAWLQMERLLGRKVFLGLHVKVVRRWTDDAFHLRQLGYE